MRACFHSCLIVVFEGGDAVLWIRPIAGYEDKRQFQNNNLTSLVRRTCRLQSDRTPHVWQPSSQTSGKVRGAVGDDETGLWLLWLFGYVLRLERRCSHPVIFMIGSKSKWQFDCPSTPLALIRRVTVHFRRNDVMDKDPDRNPYMLA